MNDEAVAGLELFGQRLASQYDLKLEYRRVFRGVEYKVHTLRANSDLYHVDPNSRLLHLVLTGMLARYNDAKRGARHILEFYLAGDVADLDLLLDRRRRFQFQTLSQTTFLSFERDAFAGIVLEDINLTRAMWSEAAARHERTADRTSAIGSLDAQGRLARFLCEMAIRAQESGQGSTAYFPWPMTQAHIGDALSLTSVHVNRSLRKLSSAGLIRYEPHHMAILDWDGLVRLGQ
jgi:CRP-like cAMP-binding protein